MSNFVFFGDSVTDAERNRSVDFNIDSYGVGYVRNIVSELLAESVDNHVYNRGISGNRSVDLYARIKCDVWNYKPDVLTMLFGVNDVSHEIHRNNGVELDRFEKIYRLMITQTKERFPNVRIILMEPTYLYGKDTADYMDGYCALRDYAKVCQKLAREYNLEFVCLQEKMQAAAEKLGADNILSDGIHPAILGAKLIAEEWLKIYRKKENK